MTKKISLLALMVLTIGGCSTAPSPLPWQREEPLRLAAKSITVTTPLHSANPQGDDGDSDPHSALTVSNPSIKTSLWGPPNRFTISILKNDVWDRRMADADVKLLTLDQLRAGAFSPLNKNIDDLPKGQRRPIRGYLQPSGGRADPYAYWNAYPFPCQKPVGQIIIGLDELASARTPTLTQHFDDGLVHYAANNLLTHANVDVLLSMTRNVWAIRGDTTGISAPWLRIYRHIDQSYRNYMTEGAKSFLPPDQIRTTGTILKTQAPYDYQKDAAFNGPIEPPTSGSDGKHFWIRQRMPAEKTFPTGFEYVLMGIVADSTQPTIQTADNQPNLGTPPLSAKASDTTYALIREANGSAATATFQPHAGKFLAYFTVVTSIDAPDPLAEAKSRLDHSLVDGFQTLQNENAQWYAALYDKREDGRVFYGNSNSPQATESIPEVFHSWYINHEGMTSTDARKFQASASYAAMEVDWQRWHSLPCYNELFYTSWDVRNRSDALDMWWQLVEHWQDAGKQNAREIYNMPGMAIVHGYLPPIKADTYPHTHPVLEFCIDTMAQVLKVPFDQWDYTADTALLKKIYPWLRDQANFYAAYVTLNPDGYYHVIPAVEAEAWGIYPEFSHTKDTISALCMSKWMFLHAADAADILHTDPDLAKKWRALAAKIAPYPEYEASNGPIFGDMPNVQPRWKDGDHPWTICVYPTTLADEVTLDSPLAAREKMIRTAYDVPASPNSEVLVLLADHPDLVASMEPRRARPIKDLKTLQAEVNRHPERLLNSRGPSIHLFPDIPQWAPIAFRHFQARGGFLISAVHQNNTVQFLEIESRRDLPCNLYNPWPARTVLINDITTHTRIHSTLSPADANAVTFPTQAGHIYQLSPQ